MFEMIDMYYLWVCVIDLKNGHQSQALFNKYHVHLLYLQQELRILSRLGSKLHHNNVKFERLDVDASLAQEMFEDNRLVAK